MNPVLVVQYPDGREDTYRIDASALVVGSDSSCDIAVQEPGIAPELFRLRKVGAKLLAESLVRDASLLLDGRMLGESAPFPVGAEIRAAGIRFLLRWFGQLNC